MSNVLFITFMNWITCKPNAYIYLGIYLEYMVYILIPYLLKMSLYLLKMSLYLLNVTIFIEYVTNIKY